MTVLSPLYTHTQHAAIILQVYQQSSKALEVERLYCIIYLSRDSQESRLFMMYNEYCNLGRQSVVAVVDCTV